MEVDVGTPQATTAVPDAVEKSGADVGSETETLDFPAHLFQKLMGPGGETLDGVKRDSGATVNLEKRSAAQIAACISGTPVQVQIAKSLLNAIAEDEEQGGVGLPVQNSGEAAPASQPDATRQNQKVDGVRSEKLEFEERELTTIVGPAGQSIKEARLNSGASIIVRKTSGICEVTISGLEDQVAHAKKLVTAIVESGRQNQPSSKQEPPWRDEQRQVSHDKEDEVLVNISKKDCGKVIGTGGITIKSICSDSGAQVVAEKDNGVVRIKGQVEAVEKARVMVASVLANESDLWDWETDYYMQVSREDAVKLVGKKGATKASIQEETWASLHIPIPANPGESCLVRIEGTFEAVEQAIAKIQSILGWDGSNASHKFAGSDKWRGDGTKDDWGNNGKGFKRKWSHDGWHE